MQVPSLICLPGQDANKLTWDLQTGIRNIILAYIELPPPPPRLLPALRAPDFLISGHMKALLKHCLLLQWQHLLV